MEHRKARRSFNTPGHAHFFTYSCQGRLPLLSKESARRWVIEAMEVVRQRHELDLLAYVIMPEHVHLLVLPRTVDYRLDRILTDLKRPVSWKAKQHLIEAGNAEWMQRLTVTEGGQTTFRFWLAGGGFDANVTTRKSIPEIVDYIHLNPVRRGLVVSAQEWQWSSARFWEGMRSVPIEMDFLPE